MGVFIDNELVFIIFIAFIDGFKLLVEHSSIVLSSVLTPLLVCLNSWIFLKLLYFFNECTCKDALVLEARQEGQGIYTTCQSLCHHFNPRATGSLLFCACAAEIG